jgi:hypothetical protein
MDHGLFSFLLNAFTDRRRRLERGLTPGSSWIIHLYTNELVDAIAASRPFTRDQAE